MVLFHSQAQLHMINSGSYMSAHVLLNLLNSLRKRDKMLGKQPSILSLFCKEFRFYLSYDIKIILKSYFWRENVRVLPYVKR